MYPTTYVPDLSVLEKENTLPNNMQTNANNAAVATMVGIVATGTRMLTTAYDSSICFCKDARLDG